MAAVCREGVWCPLLGQGFKNTLDLGSNNPQKSFSRGRVCCSLGLLLAGAAVLVVWRSWLCLSYSKLPKEGELRLSWAHPWSLLYQDTSASTLPCLTVLEECLRSITFCCEVFLDLSPHLSHNIMSSSLSWSLVKIKSFRLCKGCCVGSA